jgi:excisionase family DNA binding protein
VPDIDWIAETIRELKPLATASEAANVLRMSTRHLRRMITSGRITAVRARESGASRVLVPRSEIERFLRACTGEVAPLQRVKRAASPRKGQVA